MVIFVLLAIRLVVRWRTTVPPRATSGSVALDRTARLVHTAFYLLIFVAAGSGFATAELSGLPAIVLHVLGSLYHHFFVTDAIFRRMGFGSRY